MVLVIPKHMKARARAVVWISIGLVALSGLLGGVWISIYAPR